MRIKLIKKYKEHNIDEEIEIEDNKAKNLINLKIAREIRVIDYLKKPFGNIKNIATRAFNKKPN